jgi:hypothetical protein
MLRSKQSEDTTNFVDTLKNIKLEVKLPHYRPGQVLRAPGG